MESEKNNTLQHVHDAIDIIENARAINGLTSDEKLKLETASVKLRNLERTIIRIKSNELVSSLTADANALKELSNQINQTAGKLSSVATTIEKIASIVEAFINIVPSLIANGLL